MLRGGGGGISTPLHAMVLTRTFYMQSPYSKVPLFGEISVLLDGMKLKLGSLIGPERVRVSPWSPCHLIFKPKIFFRKSNDPTISFMVEVFQRCQNLKRKFRVV